MESIKYRAHVQNDGWLDMVDGGQIAGTFGQGKALECIQITGNDIPQVGICGFAYVQDIGWLEGHNQGEEVGTTGQGKHIEAVRFILYGDKADEYNIFYRLHVANFGFLNWSANGEPNGTIGGNNQAEAIQIIVLKKEVNGNPISNTAETFINLTPPPPPEPPSQPTKESEESMRIRLVKRAENYVGYVEDVDDNTSYFGTKQGDPTGEWCAYFDWTIYQEEGLEHLIPKTGYCPYAVDWFLEHPTAYFRRRGTYIPNPADLIYFDWDDNGVPNHTGIVQSCDGSRVFTIEGNTGDPPQVSGKCWDLDDTNILGYGVPDFSQV